MGYGKEMNARKQGKKTDKAASTKLDDWGASETVEEVFWTDVDAETIAAVMDAVTRRDMAIMFHRSRKGDVLGVTVFDQGTKKTAWEHEAEAMNAQLNKLYERVIS